MSDPAVNYTSYLRLDDLLDCQSPVSEEHDEMLFIVIHQVYELWFKQLIWELDLLRPALERGDTPQGLHTFGRILAILKTAVAQLDVLETMTPLSFSSFRDRLSSASGFQSAQFREFEFILGHRRESALVHYAEGSPQRQRLERRMAEPSLFSAFLRYLSHGDYGVTEEQILRPDPREPTDDIQDILLAVYQANRDGVRMAERMVDLDEGIQEWRYRHVKMVERTIGGKMGTGGSAGAAYLRTTLFRPIFPDLWAIRTRL